MTVIPFLAFGFMMFFSTQVEWMHQFYQGTMKNVAWRFIQGGLYFRTYGLPLVGNPYRANEYTYVNVNGEFIQVGILDSSFAAYIIMRGMIWMTYTLLWLCVAHWKALKKRDYAIILLETVLLGFAMMERPGLEMWYNFILLYPLAKVIRKPRTERALEFGELPPPDFETAITDFEKEYKSFMGVKSLPRYRLEEAEVASTEYDSKTGVYTLRIPKDHPKHALYDTFTGILQAERFVKVKNEARPFSAGFIRYSEAQVQLAYQMGFKDINDGPSISMVDETKTGLSLKEYVDGKYTVAKEDFSDNPINEAAILSLYEFLGARSFCEIFTSDFDRDAYDYCIFEEKLGKDLFNRIDNHMHGRAEEFLFNLAVKDYKEALELI